jgi:hypothetical protein
MIDNINHESWKIGKTSKCHPAMLNRNNIKSMINRDKEERSISNWKALQLTSEINRERQ